MYKLRFRIGEDKELVEAPIFKDWFTADLMRSKLLEFNKINKDPKDQICDVEILIDDKLIVDPDLEKK